MIFNAAKLSELPLRTSLPLNFHHLHDHHHHHLLLFNCTKKAPTFENFTRPIVTSSLRTNKTASTTNQNPSPKTPWISKWPPAQVNQPNEELNSKLDTRLIITRSHNRDKGQNAIERIVLRLRNLGFNEEEGEEIKIEGNAIAFEPVTGEEKLGDLLKREWVRPDTIFERKDSENYETVLPWEREEENLGEGEREKKRRVRAPTLAELTIEDEELRRLRRDGMFLRERISVPKAGLTKEVLQKIHDKWRKNELVRLKFHEVLAHDMKTAHDLVERRTGGLVTWRAGSVMVVYRGINYQGPPLKTKPDNSEGETLFVPDVSSADSTVTRDADAATSTPEKSDLATRRVESKGSMTEEEVEFNNLLDGLGPRFEEWWGTGVLPVDADMLPQKVPGYKTPFRLLPTGMRSHLTNAEMSNLRKLARQLPCHFALGRNRNHQGLAAAIVKLWEKSLVVKIAVKRGIQNTNNKLMAEELKMLTGGVLLLRNKYFIVMYRGKDFLPTSVAAALAERQEITKKIQDIEEIVREKGVKAASSGDNESRPVAGTLAEFYEAQARWGREISSEECEKMIEEDSKAKRARLVKRIEHKLAVAQAKKLRAERLLSKIEASMVPSGPDYDQETITEEERVMFRKVGLRMKPYLPLGIRGVFAGVIENMHLHWKYREVVKLISKQKTLAFVEDTARLIKYESGGIMVAIERVRKGFALIYYRGKNYQRPISLRPRNLLTKAKALKRSVAMQRHEALSQHISELENTIEQMKKELGVPQESDENNLMSEAHACLNKFSEHAQSGDEAAGIDSDLDNENNESDEDFDDDDDAKWEIDSNLEFSSTEQ